MYNIKIITDSGCDIPAKAKLKNVDILGFYITTEDGRSFEERYEIYKSTADVIIKNDKSLYSAVYKILEVF